ncbi:MAG: 4-hydroxythreonine-4-phosphate dehydrogenase PdxA, partial [Rhodospirillales bacterium]|nr:4-hydroxythreonine-4-phosphate dehydrogenase PdxA [Rhodospirillales bacterium]
LNKKFNGITEFIAYKIGCYDKATMLIYSNKLAVTPIVTHVAVKKISQKLNVKKIVNQIKEIVFFYNKYFKKKIKIAITGLNPHCFSHERFSEEEKIIKPAIKKIKKQPTEKKQYNINQHVVYPKHGVGKIISVEKTVIAEIETNCYKILIPRDKLTLTVPINQQSNLRPTSSINQINKCVSILKTKP